MGFVPVRQLVLVDLLSMVLGVRPGERAVVAVDTADEAGTAHLCAELSALAEHVAGRPLSTLSTRTLEHPQVAGLVHRFRSGAPIAAEPQALTTPEGAACGVQHPGCDAVLLVAGAFLLRPPLVAQWDASVYVDSGTASCSGGMYRERAREHLATWVLDQRRREAPTLTYGASPGPDEGRV